MKIVTDKEQLMRHYWLNSLDNKQLELLETEWFSRDDDAELLAIARTDLISDYIAGDLHRTEKKLFEQKFLPGNMDDVIFEKSSIELSRQSKKQKKFGFPKRAYDYLYAVGRTPKLAFGATLLMLILSTGIFIKFSNEESRLAAEEAESNNNPGNVQMAAIETNAPDSVDNNKSEAVANDSVNISRLKKTEPKITELAEVRSNSATPTTAGKQSPKPVKSPEQQILFLMITRGNVESLKISDSADRIALKLDMPGLEKSYYKYELRILDASEKPIYTQPINENLSLKKSGETITVPNLKTGIFRKNKKYKPVLIGIEKNGEEKQLSAYVNFEKN